MKKAIAVLGLIAGMVATPAGATSYPDGDANCSGHISMADVNLVMSYYFGYPVTLCEDARVDMNCSGTITVADANIIQRIYFGLPVEYPEQCEE